ncbi:hypothetical protein [Rhodosalinus sp.]|uniref:hypothetical protein n=1 Tax=Rhodosalinus sp. TaxID=2047741 RepID=UPI0035632228
MTGGSKDRRPRPPAEDAREARLSAALKANLARRKAQARARRASDTDETARRAAPPENEDQ